MKALPVSYAGLVIGMTMTVQVRSSALSNARVIGRGPTYENLCNVASEQTSPPLTKAYWGGLWDSLTPKYAQPKKIHLD